MNLLFGQTSPISISTDCKKCGAPQGLIGWMCDCWYDSSKQPNLKAPHPNPRKNAKVYKKVVDGYNPKGGKTYFLIILEKDRFYEVNYFKYNLGQTKYKTEYAAMNYLIATRTKEDFKGMQRVKLTDLPKMVQKELFN